MRNAHPAALLGLFALFFWAEPVLAADLKPHRAIYAIETGELRRGSEFTGVRGAMTMSLEKTCDAWLVAQEITMFLATPDGDEIEQSLIFNSLETLDGTGYRFFARNAVNGVGDDYHGRAVLNAPGGHGEATFTYPEEATHQLPEGSHFPVGHTAWIIDSAKQDERILSHYVFDGSDGAGPNPATLFIGRKVGADDKEENPLLRRPGWNIRLAYYSSEKGKAEPDYEVGALQLDNGITPRLILDYQTFTAIMTLKRLEALPEPGC